MEDVTNLQPTDINLSATSIVENNNANATVGTLSSINPDFGNLTFTLVSGEGSDDNSAFEIDGTSLNAKNSMNYEAQSIYNIRVKVANEANFVYEEAFTINITDVDPEPGPSITELFFSEYIEGSSNNKALEIFNGTGTSVDLSAGAYVIARFSNGTTPTPSATINLTGTINDGDVFVIANSSGNVETDITDVSDQFSGDINFNGDDAVVLYKGFVDNDNRGTVVDVIGQVGHDPGSEWGSGDQSTANNTLRRMSATCGGDTNPIDEFDPTIEWDGFAQNTFDGLGSHTSTCGVVTDDAPALAESTPSNSGVDAKPWGEIEVTFSEKVNVSSGWYSINCATSGAINASFSGAGTTYTITPDTTLDRAEECTVTIDSTKITDKDATATVMAANDTITFTTLGNLVCGDTSNVTAINAIQGTEDQNAKDGETVEIEGVVVGDFQGSTKQSGFFVQEEDADADSDSTTSEGIFVYDDTFGLDVNAGDVVRVKGVVDENFGQTQLESISNVTPCTGTATASPATVTLPVADSSFLERFEGMVVTFDQTLYVTELYHLGRGGQVSLSSSARLPQPTNIVDPGTEATTNQVNANALNLIYLDDGSFEQNLDPAYPDSGLTASNPLRGGDSTTGVTGVLSYSWAGYSSSSTTGYRVHPTSTVTFTQENARPDVPDVEGTLKVASFNVLNYFNGDGNGNNIGDGRGADDLEEFIRQRDKIIVALSMMDADIIGLMELENDYADTNKSAIHDLVTGLNGASSNTYAYVDPGANIGSDEIAVGLIYNTTTVSLVGSHQILDDSVDATYYESKNRPALAQTFMQNATSGKLTVAVNHFKSKGSDCELLDDNNEPNNPIDDPDTGDGQGNCNLTRTSAASAEASWLSNDPTSSGDTDILVIGDLNAYAKEDPIKVFTNSGYTDLVNKYGGDNAYSYVFDGRWGYLDHALSSDSLTSQITGAAVWHINADEAPVLDYNTSFKSTSQQSFLYNADAYRSSDHDPVIIGLTLAE